MKLVVFLIFCFLIVASGQIQNCRTTCTRNAVFSVDVDGRRANARCSDGNNLLGRCEGCCEAWGLSRGDHKNDISGFIASDGRTCVCCERSC